MGATAYRGQDEGERNNGKWRVLILEIDAVVLFVLEIDTVYHLLDDVSLIQALVFVHGLATFLVQACGQHVSNQGRMA